MSPIRVRSKEPDQACAEAVGLARAALADVVGAELVGEHLGVEAGGDRVVTHLFSCLDPAYPGWRWAVTVTRASRARNVTVDDSALIPGPEALLALSVVSCVQVVPLRLNSVGGALPPWAWKRP